MSETKPGDSNDNALSRVSHLLDAERTLAKERLLTSKLRTQIKSRILKLLENNSQAVADFVARHGNPVRGTREIPPGVERNLSKAEFSMVSTLLGRQGKMVSMTDLVKTIFDKDVDPSIPFYDNPESSNLRSLAKVTRRKIHGWGVIHTHRGRGYSLEVTAK